MRQDAEAFVGNSASTFSKSNKYSIQRGQGAIGRVFAKTSTALIPIRQYIKWVFTLSDVKPFDGVHLARTVLVRVCVCVCDRSLSYSACSGNNLEDTFVLFTNNVEFAFAMNGTPFWGPTRDSRIVRFCGPACNLRTVVPRVSAYSSMGRSASLELGEMCLP